MKHCSECDIDLSGDLNKCPLCHAGLTGEAEPSAFPRNKAKESGFLAMAILGFATGICLILLLLLWQLHSLQGNIVFVGCLALVVNYLFVRNILVHSPGFLRVVVRYFLLLLAVATLWFLVTWNLAVTTYVIPSICVVALIFDAILVIAFRGTFVTGYAKYLLFNVFLGLAPLALVALGLTTWNALAFVSAFLASIFLLVLAVFTRKQLIAELRKLFSA